LVTGGIAQRSKLIIGESQYFFSKVVTLIPCGTNYIISPRPWPDGYEKSKNWPTSVMTALIVVSPSNVVDFSLEAHRYVSVSK
jgi:hypothetical protein